MRRGHKMLTKELREKLPALYSQEDKPPEEVPVVVKFFSIASDWTWYATEFDGEDIFFGFVRGLSNELGYFSLTELSEVTFRDGVPAVERDCYWSGATLAEVMEARK